MNRCTCPMGHGQQKGSQQRLQPLAFGLVDGHYLSVDVLVGAARTKVVPGPECGDGNLATCALVVRPLEGREMKPAWQRKANIISRSCP